MSPPQKERQDPDAQEKEYPDQKDFIGNEALPGHKATLATKNL